MKLASVATDAHIETEECNAVAELKETRGLSIDDLAKSLGRSSGWVKNRLAAHKAGADLQPLLDSHDDVLTHVAEIDKVQNQFLRRRLASLTRDGASVAVIRAEIAQHEPQPVRRRKHTTAGQTVVESATDGQTDAFAQVRQYEQANARQSGSLTPTNPTERLNHRSLLLQCNSTLTVVAEDLEHDGPSLNLARELKQTLILLQSTLDRIKEVCGDKLQRRVS